MNVAAFVLLAGLIAAYVVLDGYDLGVGALHLFLGRTREQRGASFAMIGPYWNGNEVLLIAAGAALFALFPRVYAAAFSGFYLPFIILLWLLMVRGMSIELREHLPSELWQSFWDAAFAGSSVLLILVLGLAIGNIVRGVPLDAQGYFAGTFAVLLNPYSLTVALLALASLAMHGAAFALWRSAAVPLPRAAAALRLCWWIVLPLLTLVTAETFFLSRIHLNAAFLLPAAAVTAGLAGVRFARANGIRLACSSLFVGALVGAAAAGMYPYLLLASPPGTGGLSIFNGGGNAISLTTAFTAALIGTLAAFAYATLAARRMLADRH